MTTFLLILGLVLFVFLVVIHEWGHFIVARRGGVDVDEFGIGFPPKVWGKSIGKGARRFIFSINALPLGGFVKLKGENDADRSSGSFGSVPLGTKIKIMLAGVGMNLLVAYIILLLLAIVGMPQLVDNQYNIASDSKITRDVEGRGVVLVSGVLEGTPAQQAGIKQGERIIKINDQAITNPTQVGEATSSLAGQQVTIILSEQGQNRSISTRLNPEDSGKGYLGVTTESGQRGLEIRRSTWSSPIVAAGTIAQFTHLTLKGIGTALGNLVTGNGQKASEQVTGPVGIFVILREGTQLGILFVLMLIAIISLTLAIVNALPIPALDGGRLFVTLLFRAMGWRLTKSRENMIHGTGFMLLIGLIILITIVDVKRFF